VKSKTTVKRDAYGITRFITDYKTSEPRRQEGKALREPIPRVSHAEFNPPSDRPDPVEVIKESGKGRLEHLIPIRYGRMSKNVFANLPRICSDVDNLADPAQVPGIHGMVYLYGTDRVEVGEITCTSRSAL